MQFNLSVDYHLSLPFSETYGLQTDYNKTKKVGEYDQEIPQSQTADN